jgi:Ca2+-binding RTX toxin-like protein
MHEKPADRRYAGCELDLDVESGLGVGPDLGNGGEMRVKRMRVRGLVLSVGLAAIAGTLVLPTSALAGSLARSVDGGGYVTYTFAGGTENDTLTATRNATTVSFTNAAASFTDGGGVATASCTGITTTSVTCPGTVNTFVLDGNNGNDTLVATGTPVPYVGRTQMTGGIGSDTLTGSDGIDLLDGGADNDTLNGNGGNDDLSGTIGNDALNGGDGDDILSGGDGTDTLSGGNNNDTMTPGLGDDNVVTGGDDVDLVSYNDGRANPVNVDLAAGGETDGGVDDNVVAASREALVGVEGVTGSPYGDTLAGDGFDNTFRGLGGVDTINALAGSDFVDVFGDGAQDIVDCGANTDEAKADVPLDLLTACETIDPGPSPTPPAAQATTSPTGQRAAALKKCKKKKSKKARKKCRKKAILLPI